MTSPLVPNRKLQSIWVCSSAGLDAAALQRKVEMVGKAGPPTVVICRDLDALGAVNAFRAGLGPARANWTVLPGFSHAEIAIAVLKSVFSSEADYFHLAYGPFDFEAVSLGVAVEKCLGAELDLLVCEISLAHREALWLPSSTVARRNGWSFGAASVLRSLSQLILSRRLVSRIETDLASLPCEPDWDRLLGDIAISSARQAGRSALMIGTATVDAPAGPSPAAEPALVSRYIERGPSYEEGGVRRNLDASDGYLAAVQLIDLADTLPPLMARSLKEGLLQGVEGEWSNVAERLLRCTRDGLIGFLCQLADAAGLLVFDTLEVDAATALDRLVKRLEEEAIMTGCPYRRRLLVAALTRAPAIPTAATAEMYLAERASTSALLALFRESMIEAASLRAVVARQRDLVTVERLRNRRLASRLNALSRGTASGGRGTNDAEVASN